MAIAKEIFGVDRQYLSVSQEKMSKVDQAYFLYYGNGRQGDVFGTKGAMAMLCLEIIAQCPELSGCRIGTYAVDKAELLTEEEILFSAAEFAKRGAGAVPSFQAGMNLSSWRGAIVSSTNFAVA